MKIKCFYSTLIALLLTTIACSTQDNKNDKNISNAEKSKVVAKECIALNDAAVKILNKYYYENSDPAKLDVVLGLLNDAIDCDTSYFLAYNNKVTVLSLKGEYKEVVNLLNKIIEFSNNDPQLIFFKGIAYEKLKDYSSAETAYKQASLEYEKLLKLYPDSLGVITDKLFFIAFTEGKDKALAELKEYVLKHPDNNMLKEYQSMFENFNRKDFMSQYRK